MNDRVPAAAATRAPPAGVGRFRKPRAPAPPPGPQIIATTGANAKLDAMADVLNTTAAPFMNAAPAHQGALGEVQRCVGAGLSLLRVPDALLDTGFAMATAGIASSFPSMPAAVIGLGVHLGIPHTHTHPPSLVPPAPPVPLPSIGTVMLAGAVNVLVNGVPAARAGDVGIAITCGSLAPPLEVILGSSSVFIGGQRAARVGDMTRHCNPMPVGAFGKAMGAVAAAMGAVGAAVKLADAERADAQAAAADSAAEADAAAAAAAGASLGAALTAAQAAADAAALAMQLVIGKDPAGPPGVGAITVGSGNVMIGGFPCPNLMETLKGLLRAAKGLRRKADPTVDAEGDAGAGPASCTLG